MVWIPQVGIPDISTRDYSQQLYNAAAAPGAAIYQNRRDRVEDQQFSSEQQRLKEASERDYALELQKLEMGVGTDSGYFAPQLIYNPETGKWGMAQPSKSGGAASMVEFPEGWDVTPTTTSVDTGTGTQILTRGVPGPIIPKDIAGAESQQEAGAIAGKTAGALPQIESDANITIKAIDELLADPYLEKVTGDVGGTLPAGLSIWSSVREGSRLAQSRITQIIDRTWLTAYNQLRGAQAITDVEGLKAENAMSVLRTQNVSDEAYRDALKDLRDVVIEGVRVARAKAQGTAPATDASTGETITDTGTPVSIPSDTIGGVRRLR